MSSFQPLKDIFHFILHGCRIQVISCHFVFQFLISLISLRQHVHCEIHNFRTAMVKHGPRDNKPRDNDVIRQVMYCMNRYVNWRQVYTYCIYVNIYIYIYIYIGENGGDFPAYQFNSQLVIERRELSSKSNVHAL